MANLDFVIIFDDAESFIAWRVGNWVHTLDYKTGEHTWDFWPEPVLNNDRDVLKARLQWMQAKAAATDFLLLTADMEKETYNDRA
jgi:hypothetical protein